MKALFRSTSSAWLALGPRFLPFADAASDDLPLPRLLRLSLFQVSVGMVTVLLTGTLNRVMIVEMNMAAWIVALMVSLPLVFAPLRALIGHKSDTYSSALGWRRAPFIWYGTMLQWGGLAFMPFALLVMSDAPDAPQWAGPMAAAAAFLFVGAGIHTTQTAGLALATDLAPEETRPRVVALLYVMLLVGMLISAVILSGLLADFSPKRLIQVIQGSALVTLVLNTIALWKQEARRPDRTRADRKTVAFSEAWQTLRADPRSGRLLIAVALGTAAFTMQDVLLEPYGGEILGLSVGATTLLTALLAGGTLIGLAASARALGKGIDPHRLAANGMLIGIAAFSLVIFASPFQSAAMFRVGTLLIGLGGGLFAVSALIAAMDLSDVSDNGLVLGAWGAVQATAAGVGLALGGTLRDIVGSIGEAGVLGQAFQVPSAGYTFVYHLEIGLLFAAIIAIGPLIRARRLLKHPNNTNFGLAEMPS
ncbi:MAG: MFS transporter [Pseudomonadota bacterium]